MSYARYYVMPRSPLLAPKLNFTASQPWIQVAIRGVDPGGKEIDTPPLYIQQGGGTLDLTAHCVYECTARRKNLWASHSGSGRLPSA